MPALAYSGFDSPSGLAVRWVATDAENMSEYEPNTRCEKCGYEWEYSGGMAVATCPSCRYNTEARNIEEANA